MSRKAPAKAHLVLGSSPRNGFIASQWRQFRRGRGVISQTILHVLATIPWHQDAVLVGRVYTPSPSSGLTRITRLYTSQASANSLEDFIHHLEASAANINTIPTRIQMTMDLKVIQNTSSSITDSHIPLQRVCVMSKSLYPLPLDFVLFRPNRMLQGQVSNRYSPE